MNATSSSSDPAKIRPPQLIQSLTGGFNAVASHIYLILLPVALDLLLWFGPHLRVKELFQPVMVDLVAILRSSSSVQNRAMWDGMENLWIEFLEGFNLASLLSTFPVGVPALMGVQAPMQTPVGPPTMLEATSAGQILLGWLGLTFAGLALGTLYFATIAQCCGRAAREIECDSNMPGRQPGGRMPSFRMQALAWQGFQVVLLLLVLIAIALVLLIPTVMITSFLFLISPLFSQFVMLLISVSAVYLLVPLVFSPHGIFLCGMSVFNAMLTSTRVVRFALPGTGLFLVAALVIYQGLGVLWRVPPDTSWMALVGILGHAFISTGLLAASFIYYQKGLAYVQSLRRLAFRNTPNVSS